MLDVHRCATLAFGLWPAMCAVCHVGLLACWLVGCHCHAAICQWLAAMLAIAPHCHLGPLATVTACLWCVVSLHCLWCASLVCCPAISCLCLCVACGLFLVASCLSSLVLQRVVVSRLHCSHWLVALAIAELHWHCCVIAMLDINAHLSA